jgi:hypothetical protein
MNPLTNPDAYDYAVIAGKKTPGLLQVVGAGSPRTWDKRKGMGLSGAWLFYMGDDLSEFSLVIRIWTKEQWAEWEQFYPLLQKAPVGTKPKALEIFHPHLAPLGIKAIVVRDVMAPEQTDDGMWEIEVKVTQFRAPKPAIGKPDAAKAKEAPKDDVDRVIENLTKQVQDLAK